MSVRKGSYRRRGLFCVYNSDAESIDAKKLPFGSSFADSSILRRKFRKAVAVFYKKLKVK